LLLREKYAQFLPEEALAESMSERVHSESA